jgi:hypothetical protein
MTEQDTDDTEHRGEVDIELEVAALASEAGFRAGEYEVADVWVADSDGIVQVEIRETGSDTDRS